MSIQPDGINHQIRATINETVAKLEALGCSRQTALGVMVVQATIRMDDCKGMRELADFMEEMATDCEEIELEEAADASKH